MIAYSPATKNAMMTVVKDMIDAADPTPGKMLLYTADQPIPGVDITTQTLVANIPLALPCGTVSDGVLTLIVPIEDPNSPNSGAITWGRLLDGDDNWVTDFDVDAENPSTATLKLNVIMVYQGGIVRINEATLTIA